MHDGRHTFAARTRQAGIPLEDIKDFLGHKDVSTTQVYAHISESTRKLYRRANKKALKLSAFFKFTITKLSLILFRSEHVSITDYLNLAKNPYLTGVRSIL